MVQSVKLKGISIMDFAKQISKGLANEAVGARLNGKNADLTETIDEDSELNILKFEDEDGKDFLRHTSAHILAQAVKRLYPNTKLAIGPPIKDGFYYDFDSEHTFTPEDLEKIEQEMKRIIKEDLSLERFVLPRDKAIEFVEEQGEDYKIELIEDLLKERFRSINRANLGPCAGPCAFNR